MKKKTYKQMQNRLYREIKRRIEAEKRIMIPCRMCTRDNDHIVKSIMANIVATKLLADEYIAFYSHENHYEPITDVMEIEARLDVVRPKEIWPND